MAQTTQKTPDSGRRPYGVLFSKKKPTTRPNKVSPDTMNEQEGQNRVTGPSHNIDANASETRQFSKKDAYTAFYFLLSVGSLVWLAVTGTKVNSLEEEISEIDIKMDSLEKEYSNIGQNADVQETIEKLAGIVESMMVQMEEWDKARNRDQQKLGTRRTASPLAFTLHRRRLTVSTLPPSDKSETFSSNVATFHLLTKPATTVSKILTTNAKHKPTLADLRTQTSPVTPHGIADDDSNDFDLAFLPGVDPWYTYQLRVLTEEMGSVEVTGHGLNLRTTTYNITDNSLTIDLPQDVVHFQNGIKLKSLSIHSNFKITVIGQVRASKTLYMETFLALPRSLLSFEYIVASHAPYSGEKSQFLILSTADNTRLEIKLRHFDGSAYVDSNIITVQLQNHETYQYRHDHDLTGTIIKSNHKIGVYAGDSLSFTYNSGTNNVFQEQLLPTNMWSTKYVVSIIPQGYIAMIMSKENETNVTIDDGASVRNIFLRKSGDLYNIRTSNSLSVHSSSPVIVYQIAVLIAGFPSMISVLPTSYYQTSYTVYCVYTCYVSVVIQSNAVTGLRLDNQPMLRTTLTKVPQPLDNFWTGYWHISAGVHHINNTDPTITFGAICFGIKFSSKFGHPCGLKYIL